MGPADMTLLSRPARATKARIIGYSNGVAYGCNRVAIRFAKGKATWLSPLADNPIIKWKQKQGLKAPD